MFGHKSTYLDYAAITPWAKGLLSHYRRLNKKYWHNPDAQYDAGYKASELLEASRKDVAQLLSCHSDEIVYTSGGTEGNNLCITGVLKAWQEQNPGKTAHVVTTSIEHSSVKEVLASMKDVKVTELAVDENGLVNPDELRKVVTADTVLVSVGYVNNEIGTVQPLADIAKQIRWARSHITKNTYPYFHTDASQAALTQSLSVVSLGVDLLTLDGSKFYGPRPSGCVFVKRGIALKAHNIGGGQEEGRRSGTVSAPLSVVFSKALIGAVVGQKFFIPHVQELRACLKEQLQLAHIEFHEHAASVSVPHIVSVAIVGIDAEWLQQQLAAKKIYISTKSTCLGDDTDSYVLTSIASPYVHNTIRVSFGYNTTCKDVKRLVQNIAQAMKTQSKAKAFDSKS